MVANDKIEELIKIADGGTYMPPLHGRKHWYSLSKSLLEPEKWEYQLDDQLVAIEVLGETRNQRALTYL